MLLILGSASSVSPNTGHGRQQARGIEGAEQTLAGVIQKARFWETFKDHPLNERQRKFIRMLLNGFEGMRTSSKWAALKKSSPGNALRDINDLISKGILVREPGGGRSTRHALASIDQVFSPIL